MTDTDIKASFVEALDLASDARRAAYLDRACGGSPGVRARVEALLAAISQAGSFLETPALAREAGREHRAGGDSPTLAASSRVASRASAGVSRKLPAWPIAPSRASTRARTSNDPAQALSR